MPAPTLEQRLGARTRPEGPPAMRQVWQHLLFLHWEADPAELTALLPAGLHLDLFEGKAWLGIVPFFMRGVRPRGLPAVPGLSNFLELNVRTYVHDDEGLPGVWFFSLDASNAIACAIARAKFHLPYFDARMRATSEDWIDYDCLRHGEENRAVYRYRGNGAPHPAAPGSFEFFLLERYDLYACDQATQRLFRGRVHHAPYLIQGAQVEAWSLEPLAWNHLSLPGGPPDHVCYSAEADVEVFKLHAMPPLPPEEPVAPAATPAGS